MKIHLHIGRLRDAERLSRLCNDYPYEMVLHAGAYRADPKSTLGVLAMMYSDTNMLLDTGEMPDAMQRKFIADVEMYLTKQDVA